MLIQQAVGAWSNYSLMYEVDWIFECKENNHEMHFLCHYLQSSSEK